MKIRVFEAFAGYGSQAMALKRLGRDFPGRVEFEFVGISEIDTHAIAAYNAVHGDIANYGDISMIDWAQVPDFDLYTYSFPCQDISTAGKQRGFVEGSGSRSSLLWECKRAIEAKRPKYLLMENVKALVQKKFMPEFQRWIDTLSELGYASFWQVLNAKDFQCPQNRERVFMVSVLDKNATFEFPKPFPLTKRLRDILEPEVPPEYYLNDEQTKRVLANCTDMGNDASGVIRVGKLSSSQGSLVVSPDGISPCHVCGHGNMPKIIEDRDAITGKYGSRETDPYLKLFDDDTQ